MKFIEDLTQFILSLIEEGHAIVLGLDANETPQEAIKNGAVKEGSISWLLEKTGLQEVFDTHHDVTPDSTTTNPGRFIDRVAVHGVNIQRATILRANEPANSDQLGIVVDIDLKILFPTACSPLVRPTPRKLTSNNPESVRRYVEFVKKQFAEHKIIERCSKLHEASIDGYLTESQVKQLFALDKQITEILLGAENQYLKKRKEMNFWSPSLQKAGKEIVYWRRRIRTNGLLDKLKRAMAT